MRGLTSIGLVVLFILVLLVLFNFTGKKEGFALYNNNVPIKPHLDFIDERQTEMNTLMSVINTINPLVKMSPEMEKKSLQALNYPNVGSKGLPGEFQVRTPSDPLKFSPKDQDLTERARFCQNYVQSADCSVWDPPSGLNDPDGSIRRNWQRFVNECGLSLDKDGTNYQGENHIGGLYVGAKEKRNMLHRTRNKPNRELYFRPTLGMSKTGMFSLDKRSCNIINERIQCMAQKSFNVNNCSQCYTQDSWNRLDEESVRITPEIFIGGEGKISILSGGGTIEMNLSRNVQKINFPSGFIINEGQVIQISVVSSRDVPRPVVYGYIGGSTRLVNPFKFDLFLLVESDLITGRRPITLGTVTQDNMKMYRMLMGTGRKEMKLVVKIPFSFIDTEDDTTSTCDNGPFITQKSSAEFLASNPCFGPSATPGNYSVTCLKEKFLGVGGTTEGSGYPKDVNAGRILNYDEDNSARDIDQISEFLYDMAIKASTGRDQNGNKLSINEWNDASVFLTGNRIGNACHGQENFPAASISEDCLQYIYRNQGQNNEFGATYTGPFTLSSLLGKKLPENGTTYCQPGAPLDPATESGKEYIKSLNNIREIKDFYNLKHTKANNNRAALNERSDVIKECYNVTLVEPKQEEVYWVGPDNYTYEQATELAKRLGGQLATYQQIHAAQALGANWCKPGWVSERYTIYPINEQTIAGCGDAPGIHTKNEVRAGANVYGIKPDKDSEESKEYGILPFNTESQQWNSMEVFQVTDKGYDKTKEQAADICASMGATVATASQLQKAYDAGAQWCSAGWIADSQDGKYPMQQWWGYCGSNRGVTEYGSQHAPKNAKGEPMFAVNCFGQKPNKKTPPKPSKNILNFYQDVVDQSKKAFTSYEYYNEYRPVPLRGIGLVHPPYFTTLTKSPQKALIVSAAFPGGLWYANEQKLGLFELVPSVYPRFIFTLYPTNNGGIFIRADTNMRVGTEQGKDNYVINVNRPWDGPWELWQIEPIPGNPGRVALRSYFGRYASATGMFKPINAAATKVGPNEQFILSASLGNGS